MNRELRKYLAAYFTKHENPEDEDIHSLADQLGINKHALEEEIYGMLGSFFHAGKSREKRVDFDPEQLRAGRKVEMEHTDCPIIALKIAKDHLTEIPDYYARLAKMENEAANADDMNDFREQMQWAMEHSARVR